MTRIEIISTNGTHSKSNNNLHLVFGAKEKGTFHSGRWNKGYNPDLHICFVIKDSNDQPLSTRRTVLNAFPRG